VFTRLPHVHIISHFNTDDIIPFLLFKFSKVLSLYKAHISEVEAIRQVLPVQQCLIKNERQKHGIITLYLIIAVTLCAKPKYPPGPRRAPSSTA
jgi:hypothetical protein